MGHSEVRCEATIGEVGSGTPTSTVLGVVFNHKSRTFARSNKCIGKLWDTYPVRMWMVAELTVSVSRFLYVAAILGVRLTTYFSFLKAVRRRLSILNRGLLAFFD